MATAGYLISRAAQQPPILELAVAIVGVRFFGVSRGVAALPRAGRLARRHAARDRDRAHAAVRAARAAGAGRACPACARATSSAASWPTSTPCRTCTCVPGPDGRGAAGRRARGRRRARRAAGRRRSCWRAFLLVAGGVVPLAGVALNARRACGARRPRAPRLTAELLDALAAAPELVAYGAAEAAAERVDAADGAAGAPAGAPRWSRPWPEGRDRARRCSPSSACWWSRSPAVRSGALRACSSAMLALLALAAFEAVRPLPAAAARAGRAVGAASRGMLDLTDREAPVQDPARRARASGPGRARACAASACATAAEAPLVLDGVDLDLPAGGNRRARRSERMRARRRSRTCSCASAIPTRGRSCSTAHDLREYAQADVRRVVGLAGQEAHLFPTSHPREPRASPARRERRRARSRRCARARAWDWVASLPDGLDTHVGEDGGRVSGGERQRLALARALLADVRLLVGRRARRASRRGDRRRARPRSPRGCARGRARRAPDHAPAGQPGARGSDRGAAGRPDRQIGRG